MMAAAGCQDSWSQRVSAYHDGELAPEARQSVEAHLATCAACRGLLHHYRQLYHELRLSRGYEGRLRPVERPRAPAGRSPLLPRLRSDQRSGSWNGIAALLLVLALALTVVAGRNDFLFGPQAWRGAALTPITNLDGGNGAGKLTTPNGIPCANAASILPSVYVYADSSGQISRVTGCANPQPLGNILFADYQLGAWSPDQRFLLVFSASALAVNSTNLYLFSVSDGVLQPVDLRAGLNAPPVLADQAVWISATELIVRARTTLWHVNVITNQVKQLPPTDVARIAWRDQALFYSAVVNGHASLRRYDTSSGADTLVMALGAGGDTCAVTGGGCLWTVAWDVSLTGDHVAYQAPLPSAMPASGARPPAWLVDRSLNTTVESPLFSLPLTTQPIAVRFSPDGTRVAAQATGDANVTIANLIRGNTFTVLGNDQFAWRPDGAAILTQPATLHQVTPARVTLLLLNQTLPLPPATSNYRWQP